MQPLGGHVLVKQQVPDPRAGAGRVPTGRAGLGSDARAQGMGAGSGGVGDVMVVCGNAAAGNQRDLLGYTLNPPHKRGLFVGTGCRWLSHTCLASRAWRIKDNWFSPDRKYQEC